MKFTIQRIDLRFTGSHAEEPTLRQVRTTSSKLNIYTAIVLGVDFSITIPRTYQSEG